MEDLKDSLRFLGDLLYQYHGKKPYVLIDEYDAPPNYLLFKDSATKNDVLLVAKFISDLLSPLCKGNEFAEKVILTGVFDSLYREAGSGINNVMSYSITHSKYSDYYGFSELEIRKNFLGKLSSANQNTLIEQMEVWYDGYTDKHLYTPWPVVSHLSRVIDTGKKTCDYFLKPETHWGDSGVSDALDKIAKIFKKISKASQSVIDINNFLFMDHPYEGTKSSSISAIFDGNEDKTDVFRYMLIHFGYLTAKNNSISIPNNEVRVQYEQHFKNWITVSTSDDVMQFTKLLAGFYENQQNPNILGRGTQNIEALLSELNKSKSKDSDTLIRQLDLLATRLMTQNIVFSLLTSDKDGLKSLIKENASCSIQSLEFNIFHLAAMVGDQEIWSLLLSRCRDKEALLQERDADLKLLPGSYISLADHLSLKSAADPSYLMHDSSILEQAFCSTSIYLVGAPVVLIGGKILIDLFNWVYHDRLGYQQTRQPIGAWQRVHATLSLSSVFATIVPTVLMYYFGSMIEKWFDPFCSQCLAYTKVDVADQSNLRSLAQFEKYIIDQKDAYINIGSACRGVADILISTLTQPLIQTGGQYKELTVSLCKYETRQRDLPLFTQGIVLYVTQVATVLALIIPSVMGLLWFYRTRQTV